MMWGEGSPTTSTSWGPHMAAMWGMAGLSAAHAFMPTHWLPFVVVSRARGWALPETLGVTAIAGLAHSGTTIAVGAGAVVAAETLLSEGTVGWLGNGILLCMGLVYLVLHARGSGGGGGGHSARCHHPGHDHGGHSHRAHASSGDAAGAAAAAALVIFPAVAPCPSSVPLFLSVAGAGTWALVQLSLVFTVCTVVVMVALVGLSHGLLQGGQSGVQGGGDDDKKLSGGKGEKDAHLRQSTSAASARDSPEAFGPGARIGRFFEHNDRLAVGLCLALVGLLGLVSQEGHDHNHSHGHGHDHSHNHGHGHSHGLMSRAH